MRNDTVEKKGWKSERKKTERSYKRETANRAEKSERAIHTDYMLPLLESSCQVLVKCHAM